MIEAVINISAPGSEGALNFKCTAEELAVIERFAKAWNEANLLHAQPFIEVFKPVEEDQP